MKICVRNLSDDFNDNNVKKIFAEFGKVESASVLIDRHTGISKGMAYVRMSSAEEGKDAIEGLHGFRVQGCDLDVSELKDHHSDTAIHKSLRIYPEKNFNGGW